jgi:hypothetical protein
VHKSEKVQVQFAIYVVTGWWQLVWPRIIHQSSNISYTIKIYLTFLWEIKCNRRTRLGWLQSTNTQICVTESVFFSYFTSKFNLYNLSIKHNELTLCCTVIDFRKGSLPETFTYPEIYVSRKSPRTHIPHYISYAYVYVMSITSITFNVNHKENSLIITA